jgi:uncharacterized membrane protein
MSDNGLIVVGTTTNPSNTAQPYRWTRETGMVGLDPEVNGAAKGRYAVNVSPDGSMVTWTTQPPIDRNKVWSEQFGLVTIDFDTNISLEGGIISADASVVTGAPDCCTTTGAARWTRDRGTEDLGSLARGAAVSADGSVIVGEVVTEIDRLPAHWTFENGVTELGAVSGQPYHLIIGASADASIVYGLSEAFRATGSGVTFYNMNLGGPNALWRWTADTGVTVLEQGTAERDFLVPFGSDGCCSSHAQRRVVSTDGTVVVGNLEPTRHGDFGKIFRWTETSGVELLPLNTDYTEFRYRSMTPDGKWIAGQASAPLDPNDPPTAPWLWSEETGLLDMMSLFRAQGLGPNIAGWQLGPRAISFFADGIAIAGNSINPDGFQEAWVAYLDPIVIPEPTSAGLCLLSLACLGCRQRRRGR